MTKIEPETPIEEVTCPKCGSPVTAFVGKQTGNNIVGVCAGTLPNGFRCDVRFTYGRNASYLAKQEFIANLEPQNDNAQEDTTDQEDDTEEASSDGKETTQIYSQSEDAHAADKGDYNTGAEPGAGTGDGDRAESDREQTVRAAGHSGDGGGSTEDNTPADTGTKTRKRKGLFRR